jgi:hypothetical protein
MTVVMRFGIAILRPLRLTLCSSVLDVGIWTIAPLGHFLMPVT